MFRAVQMAFVAIILSGAAYGAEPVVISQAVTDYNRLDDARTPLAIAADAEESGQPAWMADSGLLPAWLKDVALTAQEAKALTAAMGAYGVDQHLYRSKKTGSPTARFLTGVAVAMVADAARRRSAGYPRSNKAENAYPDRAEWRSRKAAPFDKTREDRFAGLLVGLHTCTGAFTSALQRLKAAQPQHRFTEFALAVQQELPAKMTAADAHCTGE